MGGAARKQAEGPPTCLAHGTPRTRASGADVAYVPRWALHVRLTHWGLALAYFGLLGSGLALGSADLRGIPFLGSKLVREVHLTWAVLLLVLPAVAASWDGFRAAHRLWAESRAFGPADVGWLRAMVTRAFGGQEATPQQGRLNAGQKLNLLLVVGLLGGLALTGVAIAPPGGQPVPQDIRESVYEIHLALAYLTVPLILGHVLMALVVPAGRGSLRGMIRGDVRAEWAATHHAAWIAELAHARDPRVAKR